MISFQARSLLTPFETLIGLILFRRQVKKLKLKVDVGRTFDNIDIRESPG